MAKRAPRAIMSVRASRINCQALTVIPATGGNYINGSVGREPIASHVFLQKFLPSSPKNNPRSRARQRLGRNRLWVELLESRDLPAPLTWFAGPSLSPALGGAVAAADQGAAFTLSGSREGYENAAQIRAWRPYR